MAQKTFFQSGSPSYLRLDPDERFYSDLGIPVFWVSPYPNPKTRFSHLNGLGTTTERPESF